MARILRLLPCDEGTRTAARPTRIGRATIMALTVATTLAAEVVELPVQLPRFFVSGDRVGGLELVVPRGDLRPPEPNLGRDLLAIPGVYAQARAADAIEPSIRGLGFDRVATTFNGLPLVNASPERTNSPVVILGPAAVTRITVAKALPSVTDGPVTTAGRIVLTSTPDPADHGSGAPFGATAAATVNANRGGVTATARLVTRAGGWDAETTVFRNDLGDYTAPDGREVAARFTDYGTSAALGWRSESRRLRFDLLHRRLRRQDTLSLPLDGKNTDSDVVTLTDRWTVTGALASLEWHAGYASTDPYITSEDRPVPSLTYAQATARSAGGGITTTWQSGEAGTIAVGADYAWQDRRAVRTTAAGNDFIWPDAVYTEAGLFGEYKQALNDRWHLRLGGRIDDVRSNAREADQLALGRPLRAQFVQYNGAEAAATERHDLVAATNVLAQWERRPVSVFIGTGLSAQSPPVTERYRAFLNALGGDGHGGNAVELGNPALAPERKTAIEAGATGKAGWLDLEATAYAYRVEDFILRRPIGFTQPPLARMTVFGYRNIDAVFFGTELAATAKAGSAWSFPLTFALAQGRNETGRRGLSELPPWDATMAARWRSVDRWLAFEAGGRIVGARANPAPDENPLFSSTGGFSVWHLRGGLSVGDHTRFEAGIENIFNREYTEYLTPPVGPFRPARGDLLPGDRIPAPGRELWASLRLTW